KNAICLSMIGITLIACSGKVNHNLNQTRAIETKTQITLTVDFQGASDFCDRRYGKATEESEACFLDFRKFLQLSLSVPNFCALAYPKEGNANCLEELTKLSSFDRRAQGERK